MIDVLEGTSVYILMVLFSVFVILMGVTFDRVMQYFDGD